MQEFATVNKFLFYFSWPNSPTQAPTASLFGFVKQLDTHTRWDSSELVISLSQGRLSAQNITNKRDGHPLSQRDLNAQSQLSSAQWPGSAGFTLPNFFFFGAAWTVVSFSLTDIVYLCIVTQFESLLALANASCVLLNCYVLKIYRSVITRLGKFIAYLRLRYSFNWTMLFGRHFVFCRITFEFQL